MVTLRKPTFKNEIGTLNNPTAEEEDNDNEITYSKTSPQPSGANPRKPYSPHTKP